MHVVFGASGALGAAVVGKLAEQKQAVRALVRDVDRARKVLPDSAEIVVADALEAKSLQAALDGVEVVYHCVNVPYDKWPQVMPQATDNIIAAAINARAKTIVFPGNVYVYGQFQSIPAKEDHPLAATSKKGKLRIALEQKLMDAHKQRNVDVVIPRFPDYYGPNVTNKLVRPIFMAALSGEKANWIGNLDVPHDLVYIEDAAEACVLLGATETTHGQVWHVPGAGPVTGRQFLEMAFRAAGTKPNIGTLSGGKIKLAGLGNADAREMIELLYEFEKPLVLDGVKFSSAFPSFRYTPHEEGIKRTMEWYQHHNLGN